MASMTWIKIITTIFDDEKIKLIDSLPDRDAILVIWFKILCQAGKSGCGGALVLADRIPLSDEMLSTVFNRPLNTVRLALKTFQEFGMIEITEERIISIPKWEKYQQVDYLNIKKEQDRARQKRRYDKIKMINDKKTSRENHVSLTHENDRENHDDFAQPHAPDIDIDIETEKENELTCQSVVFLENEKNPSEELSTRLRNAGFSPNDATSLLKKYPSNRISMVLEYAKNKNPASLRGFVFKALREEWSLSGISQLEMDPYQKDLRLWNSFPYEVRRKYLNQGGFGSNSDYPESGWLRKVLEKIGSAS